MYPYSISDTFAMDQYLPLSQSFAAPHAVGGSHTPAKRKRVDAVSHYSTTRINATQSAASTASWFPSSSLSYPFSNAFPTSTSEGFAEGITPQYLQDASEPPAKRKRVDRAPHYNATRTATTQSAAGAASWFPSSSLSYPFSNVFHTSTSEDFTEGSSQASVATAGGIDASLQDIMPQYLQDATDPPSKRRRVSKARRGSACSVRTGSYLPGVPPFPYSPNVFPTFTLNTPTDSPFDSDSFVEGSSTYISQTAPPVLHSAREFVPLPSPGPLDGIYPDYAPSLASTFCSPDLDPNSFLAQYPMKISEHVNEVLLESEDYELPQFDLGNDGVDLNRVGDDSWRPAPNTQELVSTSGQTAPGVSPGPTNLPAPTAPAPPISKSRPLENDAPDEGVPLRLHASGVVTYFDPHTASSPLPQGTRLQLACGHSKQDESVRCLYRNPFNDQRPGCNKVLKKFRGWRSHFQTHAVAEYLYRKHHPEASDRAVALKDPEYANIQVWICKFCDASGRKSSREDALKRHQDTSKKCHDKRDRSRADGQLKFVPPGGFQFQPPSHQRYYNIASGSSLPP